MRLLSHRLTQIVFAFHAVLALGNLTFPAARAWDRPDGFVDTVSAASHGFHHAWISRVQISPLQDELESLRTLRTKRGGKDALILLAQSRRGIIQTINGETGERLWNKQVGNRDHFTLPAAANDDYLAAVNGSTLYLLRMEDGETVAEIRLEKPPTGPPAISREWAFVPQYKGILRAYNLVKERSPPWHLNCEGTIYAPPVVSPNTVSWVTDLGGLYLADVNSPQLLFKVRTGAETVGAPCYHAPHVIVGSNDGYVYAMNELSGRIDWKFAAGEPLLDSPMAAGAAVYVVTDGETLRKLDAATGEELWRTERVRQVLSISPTRLYVTDRLNNVVTIDIASGARLDVLASAGSQLQVVNIHNDRVYLGTSRGVVQCLHEEALRKPVFHVVPVAERKKKTTETALPAEDPLGDEAPMDEEAAE